MENMLRSSHFVDEADFVADFYIALWTCQRCRFGNEKKLRNGTTQATPPHTRVRGECKLGTPWRERPERAKRMEAKARHVPEGGIPLPDASAPAVFARDLDAPVMPPPPAPLSVAEAAAGDHSR